VHGGHVSVRSSFVRLFVRRFVQSYYWDSYWIVLGLLACDMKDTAKGEQRQAE
jgi:hypothetical protein